MMVSGYILVPRTYLSTRGESRIRTIHQSTISLIIHPDGRPIYLPSFYTTHVCSLNEANVETGSTLATKGILDFHFEGSKPPPNANYSRAGFLIRRNLQYVRPHDLEPAGLAVVILELKLNKQVVYIITWYLVL